MQESAARRTEHGAAGAMPLAVDFGDYIMADHLVPRLGEQGGDGEITCLIIRDHATGYIGSYPSRSRGENECVESLRHFAGLTKPNVVHTDNAPELLAMSRGVDAIPAMATPHRSTSNSIMERTVGRVQQLARALMAQSGLPVTYWPYAVKMSAIGLNLRSDAHESSAWKKRHVEDFTHKLLPFVV